MTDLELLHDLRGIWLRHRADHKARIEAAQREVARADSELDAIDSQIAGLRLRAAQAQTETGATA